MAVEKSNPEHQNELFYDMITKISREFLSEEYKNIEIKIVCICTDDKWNIIYVSLKCASKKYDQRDIVTSEDDIFILYKKIINIQDFLSYFKIFDGGWVYVDDDFKFNFIYSIFFNNSIDAIKQNIECNQYRQRLNLDKQMHIEYFNTFGTTATGFSFNPFYEEDFTNENNNLVKAEEVVRKFLDYKINGLCSPAIFIIYPIESFNFSFSIDFQDSGTNLSLNWGVKQYYKDKIMCIYEKDNERKQLSTGNQDFFIPYDYSGKIEIKFTTRSNFKVCSSKEELFQYTFTFPENTINELIIKLEIVNSNEEYKSFYEISKQFIYYRGLEDYFRDNIEKLKPDALIYYMGGSEYSEKFVTLPEDKKKLQNKKKELVKIFDKIIKFENDKNNDISLKRVDVSLNTGDRDMDRFITAEINENLMKLDLPKVRFTHFIDLLNFLVNKMIYNQNYKDFLQNYADKWFEEHKNDIKIDMETKCFQPFMREKLKEKYDEECIDTPDEARGHIDLKISFTIPIELKVLRDDNSNDISGIKLLEKKYLSQFEAEIINTRVGFLIGLDYRKEINLNLTTMPNREYIKFIWKLYSNSNSLIVLLIFSVNKKSPSQM